MKNKEIVSIEPILASFDNLKSLNLSFNMISKVEYLPPNIEELYMNGNCIDEIRLPTSKPIKSLIHFGAARNKIKQPALVQLVKVFPNLFSLDVSFNNLCTLKSCLTWLKSLENLRMLYLEGNPLVLTPNYSHVIMERLPSLKLLDGHSYFVDNKKKS